MFRLVAELSTNLQNIYNYRLVVLKTDATVSLRKPTWSWHLFGKETGVVFSGHECYLTMFNRQNQRNKLVHLPWAPYAPAVTAEAPDRAANLRTTVAAVILSQLRLYSTSGRHRTGCFHGLFIGSDLWLPGVPSMSDKRVLKNNNKNVDNMYRWIV